MTDLVVGARFSSIAELESALAKFEETTYTKLWKRDTRKIAAARIPRNIDQHLIYYEIKYTCIHGGKRFQSSGKGLREVSTYKHHECPMYIQFRASADGKALEVKSMELKHNHETSKVLHMHYASERRLPIDARNEAKNLLAMHANKKMVQQKLQAQTGKIITLRDLTNIQATLTDKNKANNLENCINILRTKYFADVCVLQDENQNFQGLFAQTETMRKVASAYPEFLAIDATYKLLKISVPLYLIITEDGACQTEIVAMCLLTNEDRNSLNWFLSTFKEKNPACTNTKCIMTDKDMGERHVIRETFPDASLIICVFHTLKTFRREVTCEKLGISQSQRNQCLELFQNLVYAKTDQDFLDVQSSFHDVAPKPVKDYYNKNWRDIRNEWNLNENFLKSNFLNNTNNRLECLNSKLKSLILKNSSLEDFVHGFFTVLISMQQERDHKAIHSIQKQIYSKYSSGTDEYKYYKYLTREAAKHVVNEIEHSIIQVHGENDPNTDAQRFTVRHGKELLRVTENHCSCGFFVSMILPCRHIFAVRKHVNLPIFEESLVDRRWTIGYFKANHRVFADQESDHVVNDLVLSTQPSSTTLSYAQKRKKALSRTDTLADLCAQRSNMLYEQRSHILDDLILYWKAGKNVCIKVIDDDANLDHNTSDQEDDDALQEAVSLNDIIQLPDDNNQLPTDVIIQLPDDNHQLPTDIIESESLSIADKANNNASCQDENVGITEDPNEGLLQLTTDCEKKRKEPANINIRSASGDISTIKMPGIVKARGRPKGQNVTVVGLPKKKKNKPLPYSKIPILEKQHFLLKQFISESTAITAAIENNDLIDEHLIEIRPEKVSHAVLDEEVNLHLIRKLLTHDAWKAVQEVVRVMKRKQIWICSHCNGDLNDSGSILCDGCLLWQHLKCVNLKNRPKAKVWFCKSCHL